MLACLLARVWMSIACGPAPTRHDGFASNGDAAIKTLIQAAASAQLRLFKSSCRLADDLFLWEPWQTSVTVAAEMLDATALVRGLANM